MRDLTVFRCTNVSALVAACTTEARPNGMHSSMQSCSKSSLRRICAIRGDFPPPASTRMIAASSTCHSPGRVGVPTMTSKKRRKASDSKKCACVRKPFLSLPYLFTFLLTCGPNCQALTRFCQFKACRKCLPLSFPCVLDCSWFTKEFSACNWACWSKWRKKASSAMLFASAAQS